MIRFDRACLGLLLVLASAAVPAHATDIHVSAEGDALGRALLGMTSGRGVTLWLAEGRYEVRRTLEIGPRHAGLIMRAVPGAEVRLSGAALLPTEKFARVAGEIFALDLKALGISDFGAAAGENRVDLSFNDRPLELARWPNDGFASDVRTAGGEPFVEHGIRGDRTGVLAYTDDRPARWLKEKDLWLLGYWFWDWSEGYQRVAQIDPVQKLITLEGPAHLYGYRDGARYQALNALAELDQPGEWYLDRDAGRLYLWPPAQLAGARIALTMLRDPIVMLDGATRVELRGITVEGGRGSGIEIHGGEGNAVTDCKVRNVGGNAIVVSGGGNHRIENCEIAHIGAGGIVLAGGERATLEPANHAAIANRIQDFSRARRTLAPAVKLEGVGHRVQNNEIAEAPHMAIWFLGNDHLIERNEIRDVCRETSDAGAIYTGRDWTARGTVIRHNHIQGVTGVGQDGGQGIYLDDMASGIEVIGNVIARTRRGILAGGGRDNVIEDNVLSDCEESIVFDNRGLNWYQAGATPPDGVLVQRLAQMPVDRQPWSTRYPRLAGMLRDAPGAPKYNVIRRNTIHRCKPPALANEVIRFGTVHDNQTLSGAR